MDLPKLRHNFDKLKAKTTHFGRDSEWYPVAGALVILLVAYAFTALILEYLAQDP